MSSKKTVKRFFCVFLCCVLLSGILAGCGIPRRQGSNAAIESPATIQMASTEPPAPAYIDTPVYHELRIYGEAPSEMVVNLSGQARDHFLEILEPQGSDFPMGDYYGLDAALELYRNTVVEKSRETTLLTNGQLDAEKLYQKVLENNSAVTVNGRITLNPFFSQLEASKIAQICQEIARVINSKSAEFDIQKVANTLERLTIFTRAGSTSNAYVSTDLALVYNPNMIDLYTMQQEALGGSPKTVWQQVMDHEIMHLIQHGANDGEDTNGVEIGFCRMYNLPGKEKTLPVDALYNTWILEAGAEIAMTEVVGVAPGTYHKKISYARSYNLSRFYELQLGRSMLDKAAFSHTLEEAYDALGLNSEASQLEFLKFLYSVEITQMDPEDFWASYEAKNGSIPEEEVRTGIRMGIRTDAVTYMTRNFFANMAHAVQSGAMNKLDTVFYMLRLWELDCFGHLNYTEYASLPYAEAFVVWYDQVQTAFLTELAQCSGLDPVEVLEMYDAYCLQIQGEAGEIIENCDFSGLDSNLQSYIVSAKENYTTAHFSRIRDVARWIAGNRG